MRIEAQILWNVIHTGEPLKGLVGRPPKCGVQAVYRRLKQFGYLDADGRITPAGVMRLQDLETQPRRRGEGLQG